MLDWLKAHWRALGGALAAAVGAIALFLAMRPRPKRVQDAEKDVAKGGAEVRKADADALERQAVAVAAPLPKLREQAETIKTTPTEREILHASDKEIADWFSGSGL